MPSFQTELLCSALHEVGPDLDLTAPQKIEEVISNCRDIIIDNDTDPDVRHMLMEVVELRASDWTLPEHVTQFYLDS